MLERSPHIDQIADVAAKALPEDGAAMWRDLKRAVIDLSPTRADLSGRLARSDGRLLDYAVVRLPDGQKLLTFLDVTESANYSKVLKERNDALVTADRLKDAFVQNVSYELRSPLTNIIGFADLLASPEIGPLNDRQRAYTDYIRASSTTLGNGVRIAQNPRTKKVYVLTADGSLRELNLSTLDSTIVVSGNIAPESPSACPVEYSPTTRTRRPSRIVSPTDRCRLRAARQPSITSS